MAPGLGLTDGTTTLTLDSGTYYGFTYFPQAADPGAETVTETAELILRGTAAEIRDAVRAVDRLLDDARRRERTKVGPRVFVTYSAYTGATAFRSEIVDGRVQFDPNPMARRLGADSPRVRVALHLTRRAWWEDNTLRQLRVESEFSAETAGYVVIRNGPSSGGASNWVAVDADDVQGSLPAPLFLHLRQGDATAEDWQNIYLGNDALADPDDLDPFLSGAGAASGGGTVGWSGASDHDTKRISWALGTAKLAALQGRYWRLLLVQSSVPATEYWVKAYITSVDSGLHTPIWSGDEVLANSTNIVDLGAMPIPPGGYEEAPISVGLQLSVRAAVGGTAVVEFVQLTATGDGQFRKLVQGSSLLLAEDDYVGDDPYNERTYWYEAATARVRPAFFSHGAPLLVWPGRAQRLRVLWDETTDKHVTSDTMEVAGFYRPRVATI